MATLLHQKVVPPFLFFSLLFLLNFSETTNSEVPPFNTQMYHGQFQPGFLFARLLAELTQTKNDVVLCSSLMSSPSSSASFKPQQTHASTEQDVLQRNARLVEGQDSDKITPKPLTTSTEVQQNVFQDCEPSALTSSTNSDLISLNNVKLVGAVRNSCPEKGLIACLQTSHVVDSVMNAFRESLRRDFNVACCKLRKCQEKNDTFAPCQMCFQQQDDLHKRKPSSSRQVALLRALSNISCRNSTYNHMPCSDLNLLALNLLAGPSSAMEWSEAINILSNCYPPYATDIMWLFQDMMGNMSAHDIRMLHNLLNATMVAHAAMYKTNLNQSLAWARMAAVSNNGGVTSQAIQVWHMTPRSVAGIVIVVVLISASLFLGFWAIYQKVKSHFFPDNTVHYSQVYMQDDYDENEEDEFDENDVYYR